MYNGMRGSMVIRLRPCMLMITPPSCPPRKSDDWCLWEWKPCIPCYSERHNLLGAPLSIRYYYRRRSLPRPHSSHRALSLPLLPENKSGLHICIITVPFAELLRSDIQRQGDGFR
ncbi:unnamed protein product, partial [Laminaria digitata]